MVPQYTVWYHWGATDVPLGAAKCRWGRLNRRLSTNSWIYLENSQGTRIVSIKVE